MPNLPTLLCSMSAIATSQNRDDPAPLGSHPPLAPESTESVATGPTDVRVRRASLRMLFLLGHLPLYCFAVGILVTTLVVMALVDAEVHRVTAVAGQTAAEQLAISEMGGAFVTLWLWCLGAFFAFVGLGSGLVAWTHRVLSRRIRRIVGHAQRIGAGLETAIVAEAEDALGALEQALAEVSRTLGDRETARQLQQDARDGLARVQRALSMVDTEADVYRIMRRAIQHLLPSESTRLMMADSSQSHLHTVLTVGSPLAAPCGVDAPARCPAVQHGSPVLFPDSAAIDACPRLAERERPCSAACVPLAVMGQTTGVLHVLRPVGAGFKPEEIAQLDAVAAALGARTGALRTLEVTQLQAGTDSLTGLFNRRSLETKASSLIAGARRLVVVMADLDHFKRLNDTYGHAAGDRALCGFAQVLRSSLRPSDLVARWGGEEFCLVLDECSPDEAQAALERVRQNQASRGAEGGVPACTASFGVAVLRSDGADLRQLIEAADAALYQAKAQGRDRVVICGRDTPAHSA